MNEHDVGRAIAASGELLDRGVYAVGKKTDEWVASDPTGKPLRTTKHRAVP